MIFPIWVIYVTYGDGYMYINQALRGFSEDKGFCPSRLEEIAQYNRDGLQKPYVAHIWCDSDTPFSKEYADTHFRLQLPFYKQNAFTTWDATDMKRSEKLNAEEIRELRECIEPQ